MSYSRINNMTEIRRAQLEKQLDNFATFKWGGTDMFKNFGVFIINDKKGSLKFYNGPSFSNEYSKPQFSSNSGDLIGVNFNRQTISFTVGVYWISAQDYRRLIACLDPLITDYIIFNFEPNYRYNVKLSKIGDSTRWIIGYENGEPRYYTELSLTFDLQGEQCAKGVYSYEMDWLQNSITDKGKTLRKEMKIKNTNEFIYSDLDTPFEFSFPFNLISEEIENPIDTISLHIKYDNEEVLLFSIVLNNLNYKKLKDEDYETLNLRYDSATGLLFLKQADLSEQLISLLTTSDEGKRIVQEYTTNKFNIPGKFNFPNFDITKLSFILRYKRDDKDNPEREYFFFESKDIDYKNKHPYCNELNCIISQLENGTKEKECKHKPWNPTFECYPRTNVI